MVADDKAAEIVSELKKELGAGLVAFVGCTHSAAEGAEPGSEVVVAEGTSQIDILKIARLWTEHISTEGLVRRFQ